MQITLRTETFKVLEGLEREPLRHCKGDEKVTFTRPFLMFVKLEEVNLLCKSWKMHSNLNLLFWAKDIIILKHSQSRLNDNKVINP